MRLLLLHSIYSGWLYFAVAGLFIAIVLLDLVRFFDARPRVRRVAGFVALLAIPLAVIAAPPVPLTVALAALTAALLYTFRGFGVASRRVALGAAAVAGCVVAVAVEVPYHFARPEVAKPAALYVIGDSLSSGGFGEETAWPELLGREAALPVTNLALASANVAMALERQVPQLPPARQGASVLVALGGNDMLGGTDRQIFETGLDQIIAAARGSARERSVIILEMPVLPGRWAYAAAVRRIARKHGCVLVPKRVVVQALLGRGNTSDGLHLTQRGHHALAGSLNDWLDWNDLPEPGPFSARSGGPFLTSESSVIPSVTPRGVEQTKKEEFFAESDLPDQRYLENDRKPSEVERVQHAYEDD